ncbi:MAG: Chromosome partition protein Smc [Eubacteriales bacterium]|jgi:predicted  nucleic acid-binding Zn-ribbon protein
MKTKLQKVLAGFLSVAVLIPILPTSAQAAAPVVTTDEAVYVNLDYYGKTEDVEIVKGCSLNGNNQFTDYGSYSNVVNMSTDAKPTLSGDSVSWNLPKGMTGRFYYQCTPKDGTVRMPWNFDVSYKLNGVPADAKKLAGASGMVEINVKATPNKNVADYYKNNFLLQVGMLVKMKDTLSVEAPGAQLQSLGDYKAVLFAGLPGEESDFTIRIGTNSFETTGVFMLMIPGTLEQLKDIKDLKEDKDTFKSSLDAIHISTNQILGTMEGMTSGLNQLQSGASSLDSARGIISSSKGNVYNYADKSLDDLTKIANNTSAIVPHLQKGQQLVLDVNNDVNSLVQTLNSSKSTLSSLSSSISSIRSDVKDIRDNLDDASGTASKRNKVTNDLTTDLKAAKLQADQLKTVLPAIQKDAAALQTNALSLKDALSNVDVSKYYGDSSIMSVLSTSKNTLEALQKVSDETTPLVKKLSDVLGKSDALIKTGDDTVDMVDSYLSLVDQGMSDADDLLKHANNAGADLKNLLATAESLVDNINTLNTTLNQYKDDSVNALKDTQNLMQSLTNGIADSHAFLASLESMVRLSGNKLDDGTRKTLNGLISVLEQSLDGIGNTPTIRDANNKIHDAIDKEIDKFQDDNNLLNLDSQAKPISFTSLKNPAPSSVQIVLRTQEISLDDNNGENGDLEKSENDMSVLDRIKNLFVKLWDALTSVFSDE